MPFRQEVVPDESLIDGPGVHPDNVGRATTPLSYKTLKTGKQVMSIAFGAARAPSITGRLRFVVSAWNA